jgi:transcriptional regulator with XRE-family HTH domain
MAAAGIEEATHARDIGHLSDRDIARATGAAPSTVREWMNDDTVPSGAQADCLAELCRAVERLARVVRPTYIPAWLNQPMDPLDDDDKPIERIAAGDHRAVTRLISGLEDPGAA